MRPTCSSPRLTPSYSCCAMRMVRLAEKPSLRAASCCSVEVGNGGAGLRRGSRRGGGGGGPAAGDNVRGILGGLEAAVDGPVLLRGEAADLVLAVNDQPQRHRLHPPGRD